MVARRHELKGAIVREGHLRRRRGVPAGVEQIEASLRAFCAGQLAKYKQPKSYEFIDELPRDPNGKLYKRRLRDPFWAGRDRAI